MNKNMQVSSVDAGNGGTTGILAGKKGYKRVYLPSVRARATGDSLGLGGQWEHSVEYVDWMGHRYTVGDGVRLVRNGIEHHMGEGRYGNEFHQFLVAKALADLGVKDGTVDLTVFCPPGLYRAKAADIVENFAGDVEIRLKGDKKARKWTYDNVTVWPENIGAAALFVLDEQGNAIENDILDGNVLFLDIGAYTTDAILLNDGNFNPETLQHATFEASGVDEHIRRPVLRNLRQRHADFELLTVDDVDATIRSGYSGQGWMLHAGAMNINLESQIKAEAERFAEWLANEIIDGHYSTLRGIKYLVLVGGGAGMVAAHLRAWYPGKVLDTEKVPSVKGVHPVDMNAVGGLRLALMRQAASA